MIKLSVYIITLNEEQRLEKNLKSAFRFLKIAKWFKHQRAEKKIKSK